MVTRYQQIEHVAGILAANFQLDRAEAINAGEGWTFETSGSLGSIVRHEGVQITTAELREAITLARIWIVAPAKGYSLADVRRGTTDTADATRAERWSA